MSLKLRLLSALLLAPSALRADLSVHTDFPGGSAKVISIDQANAIVRIMPGGDITRGWPCWWCFRLDGAHPSQSVTVELLPSDQPQRQPGPEQGKPLSAGWSRPVRPSISHDGATWRHGPDGALIQDRMVYQVHAEKSDHLWVAWGPLFTAETGAAYIDRIVAQCPTASRFVLAKTREGRDVPALRINGDSNKPLLWFQARQHAWESGGSWVAAGLMDWLVSKDPLALKLRDQYELVVIPVMDVDHVATGDGGKDALPQDFNRDWQDQPHWPEVAAAQHLLKEASNQKRLRACIDLHNPAPGDKKSFFFVTAKEIMDDASWESQSRFIELARQEFAGSPIPLSIVPRETGPRYHPLWKQLSSNWLHDHLGRGILSFTLETAWNTPASTVEGYQKTGINLGRAVSRFIDAQAP